MREPEARSAAPAEPPAERFRQALARLSPGAGRLGLAVSGGPDSLALLLLAQETIPGGFEVATVDHGLRPEAAGECAFVARVCAERGIACEVLEVAVAPGNMQEQARIARYDALAGWAQRRNLEAIATAHHADDQAETVLMRLNRGSGLAGLAGIREAAVHGEARVIRPLLAWRRQELAGIVADAGLVPVSDPSNADARFDRARLRKALAEADWIDPLAISRSAALLAEAEDTMKALVAREWQAAVEMEGEGFRYHMRRTGLPQTRRFLTIEVLRQVFSQMGARPSRSDISRMLDGLLAGKGGNVAGVLATPEARGDEPSWRFEPEPRRRTG